MIIFYHALLLIVAYMLGSVPTAVWVGRIFYGIDIREHGSGNAGATNTFRVLGVKAGIPVLLIDLLKGFFAVRMVGLMNFYLPNSNGWIDFELALGIAAVIGHVFPLWAGFKGGKGVATLLGVGLSIHPSAAFLAVGVFIAVLFMSRFVSLSSMIAGATFPIAVIAVFQVTTLSLVIFSLAISILLLLTHQKNIERLLKNEESRANLFRRRKKN